MSFNLDYKFLIFCLATQTLIGATPAASTAVVGKKVIASAKAGGYYTELSAFKSDLMLPLALKNKDVSFSSSNIDDRLNNYLLDNKIEPLQLTIDGDDDKIIALTSKIALKGSQLALANYIKSNFASGEELPGTKLRLVTIDKQAFKLMNRDAFKALFTKTHRELSVPAGSLTKSANLRESLIAQVTPFLKPTEIANVRRKISANQSLSIDRDLLPLIARQNVTNFSNFRGPNCFHAALSFQGNDLAASRNINIRSEPGYHEQMINYDELWRVLRLSFYEVNPTKNPLQYGDMIVFFEAAPTDDESGEFKSLRHAATYLFDGYVYSKGSKSANSPYIVRTLAEEWETWTKYTEKMGVKVFRRSLKNVSKAAPVDPIDWVY